MANQQFYGGKLLDGCAAEQRPALVQGLAPLAFVDVRGQQQGSSGGSLANQAEAATVVAAVLQLAGAGIPPSTIGVICFFRAQVLLSALLCSWALCCRWLRAAWTQGQTYTYHPTMILLRRPDFPVEMTPGRAGACIRCKMHLHQLDSLPVPTFNQT